MSRIIIDNQSDLKLDEALSLVRRVIKAGKISNNGEQHCYLTAFGSALGEHRYMVATMLNRKSEKFIVYNDVVTNTPKK